MYSTPIRIQRGPISQKALDLAGMKVISAASIGPKTSMWTLTSDELEIKLIHENKMLACKTHVKYV